MKKRKYVTIYILWNKCNIYKEWYIDIIIPFEMTVKNTMRRVNYFKEKHSINKELTGLKQKVTKVKVLI